MRKLIIASCFLSTLTLIGQSSRNLHDFAALTISGDIKAELIQSSVPKVEIKMIKGVESDLATEVASGELKVKIKNNSWGRNGAKAEVKIYFVHLQEIDASAGSSVTTKETLRAENLTVEASSGASIRLNVEGAKMDVGASSGSSINLAGSCNRGKFDSSSGARINASACVIKNVEADASSGSNIEVWVSESIDADSSSGGRVKYKGEPKSKKLSSNMSGGSISKE